MDECGEDEHEICVSYGMTKREYFAVHALQGVLMATGGRPYRDPAEFAVFVADRLIWQLNQEPTYTAPDTAKETDAKTPEHIARR